MKDEIKIEIPVEDSTKVERLFYESNAIQSIISLLLNQKADKELIEKYLTRLEDKTIELELAKDQIGNKYCPEEHKNKGLGFTFSFENHSIIYTVPKNV